MLAAKAAIWQWRINIGVAAANQLMSGIVCGVKCHQQLNIGPGVAAA
jgi:hypothetical protein